jgi:poly-gamma-glutamate synthesis protein (capsule biosynthesis protein)
VGAGSTPEKAGAPLIVKTSAGTVGIVAMGEDFGELARVSDTQPGMTVMRPDRIKSAYFQAKAAGADWVVAYVHWGDNYAPVNAQQRYWAKLFADTGYSMVIGTGPHSVQPIKYIDSMPVVYSVGNFVFGTPGRWAEYGVKGYGLLVTANIGNTSTLSLQCIVTDNAIVRYQPVPCSTQQSKQVLTSLSPDVKIRDGVGTLPIPSITSME